MAVEGRANLIKGFLEEKDNDLIIFTTYSFDPAFFDYYLFPKLAENNPLAEVLVFIDGYVYQQTYPRFTSKTGTEYRLIPVYQEGGVFHPKVAVFYSVEKDRAKVFIGSANLTLAGFTRNAEIVLQAEFTPARGSAPFLGLMELFLGLFESKRCIDTEAHELIKNTYAELSGGGSLEHSGFWILHNLTEPILDQISRVLEGKKFPRMRVVAPFFSGNAKTLFQQVQTSLGVREVTIGIQKGNHNFEPGTVKKYLEVAEELGLRLEFKEVVFREKNRRIHAKILQLEGAEGGALLIGSPNFTEPALLSTSQDGNLEVAVLLGDGYENVLNEIHFKELQSSDDFWIRGSEKGSESGRHLKVYSAEYDESTKRVLINLEPLACRFCCKVRYVNNEEEEHSYHTSEGRILLTLRKQQLKPREVMIKTEDGKQAVVRVYTVDPLKRVMRGGRRVTIKDALRVIYSKQSVDLDEIILLLGKLTTTEGGRSDIYATAVREESPDKPRDTTFRPPRRSTVGTFTENILRKLEKFLRTSALQKEIERAVEEADEDDVDKQKDRSGVKVIATDFIKERDYKRDILRNIEKILKQLRSKDWNQNIGVATLVTELVLRIFLHERDRDFIDEFEKEKLYNHLDGLDTSNLDTETLKSFFLCLLKLNYISDYIIDRMVFVRDLFDCRMFTNPKVFSEVKGKFVEFVENARGFGVELDEEKFLAIYGNLIASTFSPGSVGRCVRTLVRNLVYCEHQAIRNVSYHVLLSFLNHVPLTLHRSVKEEIEKILKTEAENLDEKVLELLKSIVQKE
ncbi:hypothetical protein [Archaeoglobus sp.]